jgi:AcrR family transcriptional regulator
MAEVASDCNMSPGNLYRYFPGKLDIAEEIGREARAQVLAQVRSAVDAAGPSAAAKLRAYIMKILEATYDQVQFHEKVHEIVTILRRERPESWHKYVQEVRQQIAQFLEEGRASGEFVIADPIWLAEVIQAATFKFRYPQLHDESSLDILRAELATVLDLLLCGIRAPGVAREAATAGRTGRGTADLSQSETAGFI